MKPFGVVRHNRAEEYSFHHEYRDGEGRIAGLFAYAQPHASTTDLRFNNLAADCCLWFSDSMDQAQQLAAFLAKKFPQYEYVVFRSELMFKAPPGEVTKSQFTPKGLLPA